eukprot:XP_001691951.1 predicted protein [Chlamydomonas reinhardtii]
MVSAYGLLDNLTRVVLGPTVGGYVDRHERMPGCKLMLRLQNCCISGSAAAALALLWPGSAALTNPALYWPLIWVLTVLGAASSAGSTGVQIAVEREAVKALCGDDAGALASTNATMRAIDLTALLLAPLVAGVLMTAAGPFVAAAAMSAYCGGAYIPEVFFLGAAFRAAPALITSARSLDVHTAEPAEVSVYRGIGALTGLAATALFPPLSKWAGLRFCAAAGITYQMACLASGVLPVALTIMSQGGGKPSVGEVRVMVGGLVASRTGLWMYDLAVTQLIQQGVAEDHMGAVYGVQSSLQASFEMLSFVAGLLSPDPAHFHWLMLGSVCSVGTAACLVWVYVCTAPRRSSAAAAGAKGAGGTGFAVAGGGVAADGGGASAGGAQRYQCSTTFYL